MFDINDELDKNSAQNFTESETDVFNKVEGAWSSRLKSEGREFANFILPFIKVGLSAEQIGDLLKKIPKDWSFDHREMYYDFRLARWIRHIEPKDLNATVQEYLVSAGSLEEGVLYVQKILADLSKKMGATGSE